MRAMVREKSFLIYLPFFVVVVAGFAVLPYLGLSYSWMQILYTAFIYLAMAQMWNLLAGYGNLISLGQPAFIGLTAYTLALVLWLKWPVSPILAMIGGGLVAVVFALIIAYPIFRFGGLYFAIGTLIIPEILRHWFGTWSPRAGAIVGGGAGFPVRAPGLSLVDLYWLSLGVAVFATLVTVFILKSRFGLGIKAIGDDNRAASASGVNVFKLKLFLFLIAAFITGLSGTIYFIFVGHLEPASAFSVGWTMHIIIPVILGGIGTTLGPFVGMPIFIAMYFLLSELHQIHLLIKGIVLLVVLLTMPYGIVGLFQRKVNPYVWAKIRGIDSKAGSRQSK